jgi:RecJ-like exonuclease
MIKVRILDRCEFCDGEAYVFVCENVDARGETFNSYRPCEMCHGSGCWAGFSNSSNTL